MCLTNVLGRSANMYRGALTAVNETEMKPLSIFIIDLFFLYICCALAGEVPYAIEVWAHHTVKLCSCICDCQRCREYFAVNGRMAINSRWRAECVRRVTYVFAESAPGAYANISSSSIEMGQMQIRCHCVNKMIYAIHVCSHSYERDRNDHSIENDILFWWWSILIMIMEIDFPWEGVNVSTFIRFNKKAM